MYSFIQLQSQVYNNDKNYQLKVKDVGHLELDYLILLYFVLSTCIPKSLGVNRYFI